MLASSIRVMSASVKNTKKLSASEQGKWMKQHNVKHGTKADMAEIKKVIKVSNTWITQKTFSK